VADPIHQSLIFLCFQAHTAREASSLLEAARRTAAACGLPQVLLWDASEAPASLQAEGFASAHDLRPMLRPLSDAVLALDWSPVIGASRI
jgi:hypothetical protein